MPASFAEVTTSPVPHPLPVLRKLSFSCSMAAVGAVMALLCPDLSILNTNHLQVHAEACLKAPWYRGSPILSRHIMDQLEFSPSSTPPLIGGSSVLATPRLLQLNVLL